MRTAKKKKKDGILFRSSRFHLSGAINTSAMNIKETTALANSLSGIAQNQLTLSFLASGGGNTSGHESGLPTNAGNSGTNDDNSFGNNTSCGKICSGAGCTGTLLPGLASSNQLRMASSF